MLVGCWWTRDRGVGAGFPDDDASRICQGQKATPLLVPRGDTATAEVAFPRPLPCPELLLRKVPPWNARAVDVATDNAATIAEGVALDDHRLMTRGHLPLPISQGVEIQFGLVTIVVSMEQAHTLGQTP